MKIFIIISLFSFSSFALAGLSKTTDSGVITIQGTLGANRIYIQKFKDSGVCYTKGRLNDKEFLMETYKESGDLYTNGSIPDLVETILNQFDLSAYKCAVFGLFN